jgi:opacity protein-like surface antigen
LKYDISFAEGAGMITSWRLLVAVALSLVIDAGVATAQTVLVRNAPAGEAVEVVLNATKVASGTVEPSGEVTLPLDLSSIGQTQIDANVFVDICDALRRVIVVERTKLPDPQQPGCNRRDIAGLYWVRPVNTLVFDFGGPAPTMLLIKGAYHPEQPHEWREAPSGLVLFGGGTWDNLRDAVAIFCGNATQCSGKSTGFGFTAGGTFWIGPRVGFTASYVRPHEVTAQGSDTNVTFNSSIDPQIAIVAGKVGIPIGPVRLYGLAGGNYQLSTFSTTQTIDGASQTLAFKTKAWGWTYGGGMEIWLASKFGLYTELNFTKLKGTDEAGGEGRISDLLRFLAFGAVVHIGK